MSVWFIIPRKYLEKQLSRLRLAPLMVKLSDFCGKNDNFCRFFRPARRWFITVFLQPSEVNTDLILFDARYCIRKNVKSNRISLIYSWRKLIRTNIEHYKGLFWRIFLCIDLKILHVSHIYKSTFFGFKMIDECVK